MLEKAKACLRPGARESLRSTCSQTAHRSKRLVHSSFWNHGAGDLDLPPYMLSTAPSDLPLRNNGRDVKRGRSDAKEGANGGGADVDGIFCDFLYPPPASALMSRINGLSVERWEKRNARRLPDGFVQTSRGYASKAYARSAGEKSEETKPKGLVQQGYKRGDAMKILGIKPAARPSVKSVSGEEGEQPGSPAGMPDTALEDDTPDADYGFSPGELAESSLDREERIRQIMQSMRHSSRGESDRGKQMADRVLKLHERLEADQQQDVRFNMELLDWLSVFPGDEIEARCSKLYRSVPLGMRTLELYLSSLTVALNRSRHAQALVLLEEALGNIDNGDQVAIAFFRHALKEEKWQLATHIESNYLLAQHHLSEHARAERFWFLVSNIPQLLRKAMSLLVYIEELGTKSLLNEQTSRFAARFFKEALIQEFQAFDDVQKEPSFRPRGKPKHLYFPSFAIGRLFGHMTPWIDNAASFYQDVILAMTSSTCRYTYTDIQRSVCSAYDELVTRFPDHRISEEVLMRLLQRTTHYFDYFERKQLRLRTITPITICNDWLRWYGRLTQDALDVMLAYTAKDGQQNRFDRWLRHLKQEFPDFEDQRDSLWTTIYVHARRNDLRGAKAAFDDFAALAKKHGEVPPLKAWNVLIHAYHRVDDLDGAINLLMEMLGENVSPSQWSFGPVMEMLGKRGDVEGVQDLMAQYDSIVPSKREAHFYHSLMNALVNSDQLDKAELVLKDLIRDVKFERTVAGSLTGCFNILLTAHAHRRNVDAAMATYRWMKEEKTRVDGGTFAALIHSLAVYRQTNAAYKILRTGMKESGVLPTALHYAIVMAGYVKEGKYDDALAAHVDMSRRNIKPSLASKAAYLKAKTRVEVHERKKMRPNGTRKSDTAADTLDLAMKEFRKILRWSDVHGAGVAVSEPHAFGELVYQPDQPSATYFGYLISMHGKERCFEAAAKLFEEYRSKLAKQRGPSDAEVQLPMQILIAMMSAHHRAGEHDQVEKYWVLAKKLADSLAKPIPVPMLTKRDGVHDRNSEATLPDLINVEPPTAGSDASEAGFQIALPVKEEADAKPRKRGRKAKTQTDVATTASTTALFPISTSSTDKITPQQPVPGRAAILDRPLRWYVYSLSQQSRTQDLLTTVSQFLSQGYTMGNKTWNSLIQILVNAHPPLILLAFVLAERFLFPAWPGWVNEGKARVWPPSPSARTEGLQYIRARYLDPGQLMPRYSTCVHLAAALLKLRRLEIRGELGKLKEMEEFGRYVGSTKAVREAAPRAVFAVQSMPVVEDGLQRTLLRGEAGSFGREGA